VPDGLLVAGSRGFHHVTWPSALTVVDASHGLLGSLYGIARWNDADHLLTSAGVFAAREREGGARFERIEGPPATSAHDLLPLESGRALLATSHRLLLLTINGSAPLSDELVYPRLLQRSTHAAGRIYVGSEDDLRVIAAQADGWRLLPRPPPEAARRVTSIVERSAAEVWTGTDRRGVWRHRLDADGTLRESLAVDAAAGLRYGGDQRSVVFELPDGRLGASTAAGLFVLGGDRFDTLLLGNLGALREPGELLVPVLTTGGAAWAYSDQRLLHSADALHWSELPARRLRQGYYSRHSIGEAGEARFLSDRAMLIHQPRQAQASEPPPQLRLRRVTRVDTSGGRQLLALEPGESLRLPAGAFALDFRYALADLTRPRDRSYRARLVGHESAFSEWSAADGYTYWGLPAGSYRFEAQARDAEGRISAIQPYALVIEPAWFDRWPARVLWLLLALLLGSALLRRAVRQRTRRLLAQTRQLESTVAERTQALAEANRRLEEMAHVDGLTGISNRRRLDQYLASVHAQCAERGRSIGVLAIDADRFKDFNDRYGHPAGDELLRRLVGRMNGCLRRSEDLLGRFGGEEFLVVLPGASPEIAAELAERMRAAVEDAALGATISIGVAAGVPDAGDTPDGLVQRADTALYRAKQGGRNRVVFAEPG
jgi:diguanylate cyclase (GGDEF)-like protein